MSGRENKKIQRGIRRESRKVSAGMVQLINGSPLAWRARLAAELLLGKVRLDHLIDTDNNKHLR